MFCSNCGKQLPDDTKFCSHCGAQQPVSDNTDPAPKTTENQKNTTAAQNQQTKKAPKKKTNILVVLAIVLGAFLLGKFVIAPSMVSDPGKDNDTADQGSQTQPSTENNSGASADSVDPAYDAVFEDTYIVHFQTFFGLETASFASEQDGGIVCCSDYGYEDDIVKQWVETMYIPVFEYTDSQKTELESNMRSQFTELEAISCCTVEYKMSTNYFTITVTYSDVDQAENYSELYNAGILQANTFISMSATEEILLSQGFVKK